MNIKKILSLLLIISMLPLFAQKEEKKISKADENFEKFAYIDAREVYLEVAKSGYKSENIFKKLGDSYYFNNDLPSSLKWYEELYAFQKKMEPIYLFRYAMALKSVKRYKEADQYLNEYKNLIGATEERPTAIDKNYYRNLIEKQSGRFKINTTTINSSNTDFSPSYYMSKIVFASNRLDNKTKNNIDSWNNKPFLDLYAVNLKKDNTFDKVIKPFSDIINSPYHESSPVFTKDGKTMFFTRNNYTGKEYKQSKEGVVLLKLYRSKKNKEGEWEKAKELPFNSDEYSCAHPALNADETKLYFSSNMPGTFGKSDIFMVNKYTDGSFGTPVNLGETINTKEREAFPFVTSDNYLYFASDGHQGLGGYDIFVYSLNDKEDTTVSEAINIGEPINSPFDDFSLILDTQDNTGFFASNRGNEGVNDDIYGFHQLQKPITACKQSLNGYVTDETSKKGLPNVKVAIYKQDYTLVETTQTDEKGYYNFEVACNSDYLVRVILSGFESAENPISTNRDFDNSNTVNIPIKKGADLGVSKVMYGIDLGKILQLDPIYFDFDKSNIRYDAEIELQKVLILMNKYPTIKIDIRSHTDSRGKPEYNRQLSERRAQSTLQYLLNYGIERNRLTAKGFGDSEIINQCIQGIECTEEEHQMNRRSEFILMNKDLSTIEADAIKTDYINTEVSVPVRIVMPDNTSSNLYDFSNTNSKIYTVQIGALTKVNKDAFNKVENVFYHTYSDGKTRYFSGIFQSKRQAKKHMKKLNRIKIKGFVVKLEGEDRE